MFLIAWFAGLRRTRLDAFFCGGKHEKVMQLYNRTSLQYSDVEQHNSFFFRSWNFQSIPKVASYRQQLCGGGEWGNAWERLPGTSPTEKDDFF